MEILCYIVIDNSSQGCCSSEAIILNSIKHRIFISFAIRCLLFSKVNGKVVRVLN